MGRDLLDMKTIKNEFCIWTDISNFIFSSLLICFVTLCFWLWWQ